MKEFNLHERRLANSGFYEIVNNHSILHFDDFPILYIGTNSYGNKILGSHLDEFDESKTVLTLHTVLSNKDHYEFLHGKLSYLEILKKSTSTSVVEKDYNLNTINTYEIDFNSIPQDYLPLKNSFCPVQVTKHSLNFELVLKGKLADLNKATSEQISKIQNGFSDFLEDRVKSLKGFNFRGRTMLQPYAAGSFKINFELDLRTEKTIDLFIQHAPVEKYISTYLSYISDNFNEDKEIFKDEAIQSSEGLKKLEELLDKVYITAGIVKPENLPSILREDILKSVEKIEKITEQVGDNFENISILNVSNNEEFPLAYFDKEFSTTFQGNIEEIDIAKKGETIDDDFKTYNIYIYHLNTDSRRGNAFVNNRNSKEMSKPKLKINGQDGLDHTKYTESLYLNKWIDVKAKARKIGDKFINLEIEFENS
jgi:hypothetical protein